jgi:hypothetical protein
MVTSKKIDALFQALQVIVFADRIIIPSGADFRSRFNTAEETDSAFLGNLGDNAGKAR